MPADNKASDKHVVILMGGWTAEAEISRLSADFCCAAARRAGWDAHMLELDREMPHHLKERRPARIFNALHGEIGEDGSVQGMLNILNIPYTHSGVLASATAMDKEVARLIFTAVGIKVPPKLSLIEDTQTEDRHLYPIDYEGNYKGSYVIKPRNNGSSFGVVIISEGEDAPSRRLWSEDTALVAEAYIPGRELTVSVLDGQALAVTEICACNDFYDFDAKYKEGGSIHILPADIPQEVTTQAKKWAELAFQTLGCRGVARADFRWDEDDGQLYMLEINTQPGMTKTSLTPEQAAYAGLSGEQLVNHLLEIARCD